MSYEPASASRERARPDHPPGTVRAGFAVHRWLADQHRAGLLELAALYLYDVGFVLGGAAGADPEPRRQFARFVAYLYRTKREAWAAWCDRYGLPVAMFDETQFGTEPLRRADELMGGNSAPPFTATEAEAFAGGPVLTVDRATEDIETARAVFVANNPGT